MRGQSPPSFVESEKDKMRHMGHSAHFLENRFFTEAYQLSTAVDLI